MPTPAERLTTPTQIVWQDCDALYPRAWSDVLPQHFADATLRPVDGVGQFVPLEAPSALAAALRAAVTASDAR